MNEIIELCQSTTSCMLSPNKCKMGWFLIGYWVLILMIALAGGAYKSKLSVSILRQLLEPLRFKGRDSLTDFRSTYFGIGIFLVFWVCIFFFLVGLSTSIWQKFFAWIGVLGLVWASLVAFSSWVRRCHDLGYSMLEGIFHNKIGDIFTYLRNPTGGYTLWWQIYHDKGDPTPNQFGPAPEENMPRLCKKEEIEFPEVWSDDAFKK